jgi:hypothetical protein
MFFEVVEANETEDYYEITLSFRPQGDFNGTSGQEQFFIGKDGQLGHRQVMSLPHEEPSDATDSRQEVSRNSRRSTLLRTRILVAIVAIVVVTAIAFGGFGGDGEAPIEPVLAANNPPTALPTSTQTALFTQPTSVPPTNALPTTLQSPTPRPKEQPSPPELAPRLAPTSTQLPPTTLLPPATPTPLPTHTSTPIPTHTPTGTQTATLTAMPTAGRPGHLRLHQLTLLRHRHRRSRLHRCRLANSVSPSDPTATAIKRYTS